MTKIVINACYGGFSLSHRAIKRFAELKGVTLYTFRTKTVKRDPKTEHWVYESTVLTDDEADNEFMVHYCTTPEYSNDTYWSPHDQCYDDRTDPILIQVVEELGDKANGSYSKLRIEEIASGTLYRIDEYDGYESIEYAGDVDWLKA